jgi:hypothetical protein
MRERRKQKRLDMAPKKTANPKTLVGFCFLGMLAETRGIYEERHIGTLVGTHMGK